MTQKAKNIEKMLFFLLDFRVKGGNIKGMETLIAFQPLFTAGIFLFSCLSFLVGFIALLLVGVNSLLKPLRKDIDRLEKGQEQILKEVLRLSNKKDK